MTHKILVGIAFLINTHLRRGSSFPAKKNRRGITTY